MHLSQIKNWTDRNLMVSPELAVEIVKKFVNWREFEALHSMLMVAPKDKQSLDEGMLNMRSFTNRIGYCLFPYRTVCHQWRHDAS